MITIPIGSVITATDKITNEVRTRTTLFEYKIPESRIFHIFNRLFNLRYVTASQMVRTGAKKIFSS